MLLAREAGKPTIEINPGDTELSEIVDFRIKATAKATLRALWIAYKSLAPSSTRLGR